jgi:hypothetical protein
MVEAMRGAGAVDPGSAKALSAMGLQDDGMFQRLADAQVFREAAPGAWYLDADAWDDYRSRQRMRALVAAVAVAIGAALAGWLAAGRH